MNVVKKAAPTEEEVVANSYPDHLYTHDFGPGRDGRFFQVVHEDNSSTIQISERTMLKIVYIPSKRDVESFHITKLISGSPKETIRLSNFNMSKIKAFLSFISEIDLGSLSERKIKLASEHSLDESTFEVLKGFFQQADGEERLINWIKEGLITSQDLVNTCYRRLQLEQFRTMMEVQNGWQVYCSDNHLSANSEEKAWQHFFQKNSWIFGYGLDYKYMSILQREAQLSEQNINGSAAVVTDFLMGDKFFTTFVEIKKPSTPIFASQLNRSRSWKLSTDLLESVSQILEQKAAGQVWLSDTRYLSSGEPLTHRPFDSKVILIIGHWGELTNGTGFNKEVKKKTFELFRRDSRNIEILTYDELFERAKFIVGD